LPYVADAKTKFAGGKDYFLNLHCLSVCVHVSCLCVGPRCVIQIKWWWWWW